MKENLIRYVDLLFAGAPDAADIKQEILQNTLDRYDDLISQGKTPEAAYQLAIGGIGDINEILGCSVQDAPAVQAPQPAVMTTPVWKKLLQAIGIFLYILCPVPLFILQNEAGLCGLLLIVAAATALMVISGNKERKTEQETTAPPESKLRSAIRSVIWIIGLCAYFALSFILDAWYITWVIFPLIAAVQGLVTACMDLKEGN